MTIHDHQYERPDLALSKRQRQCLYHILRGKSVVKTAKMLGLSPKTVESYIKTIKMKMQCHNKAQLIERSIEQGYVNINPFGEI